VNTQKINKKQKMKNKLSEQQEVLDYFDKQEKELLKNLKELNEKLFPIQQRIEVCRQNINKIKADRIIFKLNINPYDWNIILDAGDASEEIYKIKNKMIESLGLKFSGYYSEETLQKTISIAILKNDPEQIELLNSSIQKILPFIKAYNLSKSQLDFDQMVKKINIFEYTLSSSGIYELLVSENHDKFAVSKTTYGRIKIEKKFNDLLSALKYIQLIHPYDGKEEDD
jgi:prefoldin subunit 5